MFAMLALNAGAAQMPTKMQLGMDAWRSLADHRAQGLDL